MKIDRIKLSMEIISPSGNKWAGMEAQVDDAESPIKGLTTLQNIIVEWSSRAGDPISLGKAEVEILPEIQTEKAVATTIEFLIQDINACNNLNDLESYRWLTKSQPQLQEVYDKRLKELTT
jgi:hypothetical protein